MTVRVQVAHDLGHSGSGGCTGLGGTCRATTPSQSAALTPGLYWATMAGLPKIALHTTSPIWGLPSNSPACAKLETWLRMAGVPYDTPPLEFDKAPKGKIPFIVDGDKWMGDSSLIIRHIESTRGVSLDGELSARDQAISLAFRRMLKENDYWGLTHSRYFVEENWAEYRKLLGVAFVPDGPEAVGLEVAEGYKQNMAATMQAHGIGRHTTSELEAIVIEDIQAVSELLGDRTWMMGGDSPTTLDATVFGYVGNFIAHPFDDPITRYARSRTNIAALCDRIRERYFPELSASRA